MFDGLLNSLEEKIGNNYVAYAVDLVVIINGNSRKEIENKGQEVVNVIEKKSQTPNIGAEDRSETTQKRRNKKDSNWKERRSTPR